MSVTDIGGMDVSPAEEVRAAVTGFVTDFKGFQAEIETKLQQTEERMTMLDRKMTLPARTPLGGLRMPVRHIKKRSMRICAMAMMMGCAALRWRVNRCLRR
jgi:hypothetical protein